MPRAPLAAPDEMATLRGRVAQARRAGVPGPPRLLLPLPDGEAASRLVSGLSAIADFAAESAPQDDGVILRTLGTLRLGEGIDLDVFAVPSDPRMRPLWIPFAASAVGAVLLAPPEAEPAVRDAERFLREEVEVPMCVAAWTSAWPGEMPDGDLMADGLETPDGAASLVREVLGRLGSS